ncbi:MAG: hypothetical protein JWN72_875 [Thermoleophilia bacterium]|nr:hypothetical protein [Thermoleophilia bacterium]
MPVARLPSDLLRALIATLRSQLLIAATSALVVGITISLLVGGRVDAGRALAVWVAASITLTTASALCVTHPDDTPWSQLPVRAARALVQGLACCLPLFALLLLTRGGAGVHALLGLVLVPLVFVGAALTIAPASLAVAAAAAGDVSWLPGRAVALVRPRPWRSAGAALVGVVLAGLVSLPGALGGLLLTALLGPFGAIGYGMGAAVGIPVLGATLAIVWNSLDETSTQGRASIPDIDHANPGWIAGPTWQATFDGDGRWGTWLQMPISGTIAVRLAREQTALDLLTHGPDGTWIEHGRVGATGGALVVVQLAAGATWLQLQVAPGAAVPLGVVEVGVLAPAAAAA